MRMPKTPPAWTEIIEKTRKRGRLDAILAALEAASAKELYPHWDRLVRYPPPEGLSHEEWWLALKLRRYVGRREIPLHSADGRSFSYVLAPPLPERLHSIDLGAGGQIGMREPITNPATRDRYYLSSLIAEAITSSQLEGAATTREVAKEMLRSGREPRDTSERMILNNYLTMKRIGELKDEALTPELVLEIHRLVTDRTLEKPDAAGRLRYAHEDVRVEDMYGEVFHRPPLADQLEERMRTLCDFANGKSPADFVHPAIRSMLLHFWLAYDHPFVDGNGRTARALFYWSMLHHEYWLFEFVSISQIIRKAPVKYGRVFLYTETDDNDLTYFLLYHVHVIQRAIDELHAYIERKTKQAREIDQALRDATTLNHRQRALLSHALRHPNHRYTVRAHQNSHGVVHQTARTDLYDLRDRGLLEGRKIGRTWYFTPVGDLEKKLANVE